MLKIEKLLFKGFITLNIIINKNKIILKSLNSHELLEMQDDICNDKSELIYTIIYSIYKINAFNLLPYRSDYFNELYEEISKWNPFVIKKIIDGIDLISSYINGKAVEDFNNYLELDASKDKYYIFENFSIPLNSCVLTAIKGTENIGLNVFQESWLRYNSILKSNEDFKGNWEFVKFLSTVINPKTMKRINDLDEAKEQQKQKSDIEITGNVSTREGILRELYKQMRGEKDIHDVIIENFEKGVNKIFSDNKDKNAVEQEKRAKDLNLEKGEITADYKILDVNSINTMVKNRNDKLNTSKNILKEKQRA